MSNDIRFLPKLGEPYTHLSNTSGHSCVIYPVSPVDGKKGTVIPSHFRKLALAEECGVVGMDNLHESAPVNAEEKSAVIVAAISDVMERQSPDEIGADDRPKLAVIKKIAGFGVTKNQLDAAWAKFVDSLGDGEDDSDDSDDSGTGAGDE